MKTSRSEVFDSSLVSFVVSRIDYELLLALAAGFLIFHLHFMEVLVEAVEALFPEQSGNVQPIRKLLFA
jgi:hypothetical protein